MKEVADGRSVRENRLLQRMELRSELQKSNILEGLALIHMKAYGLWYFLNFTRTTGKMSWLFALACATIIILTASYTIFQMMFIFTIHVSLKKIAFLYLIVAPCLQDISKTVFFFVKMKEFCLIYDTLLKDFLKSIPEYKMSVAKEIYRRTAKKCNRICFSAFSGYITTASIWILMPDYDTDDPSSGKKKVLNGWYPFHYSNSPFYELVYVYESLITLWCGGWYCIFECAIFIPLICLCGHFDVLSYHIATLSKSDMLHRSRKMSVDRLEGNAFLNEQLRHIIKDYEKLLRYSDKMKETYNLVITIILGAEVVNLILIMLHLMFEEKDAMFVVKTGLFMSFQTIEIILICFNSGMMEEASSRVREALYFNEWYLADRKMARTQQLMMIRASVPLRLVAFKTYPVNLETLLSVIILIIMALILKKRLLIPQDAPVKGIKSNANASTRY